jgi:pSer/pThr/pTyr-binding forkhead associated (FHA) protein
MKEGSIVDQIDLIKKEFFIVGRQQDVCDIFMENPTISRKHAVV